MHQYNPLLARKQQAINLILILTGAQALMDAQLTIPQRVMLTSTTLSRLTSKGLITSIVLSTASIAMEEQTQTILSQN
jgi:hypothetical protein